MIITVTMNPAVDKTAAIQSLELHALNRLTGVLRDIGGKGINVSRTVAALGGRSVSMGFLAGETGRGIQRALEELDGVAPDFLYVPGETRTNLKLVEPGGALTELNEQGPAVTDRDLGSLTARLEGRLSPGDLLVLSGSVGPGVPSDFYRSLTQLAHEKGARVFVDADGPLFSEALAAKPDIIKPNSFELCQLFGLERADEDTLIGLARRLNGQGVWLVCVSMGADGAIFAQNGQVYRAQGLKMEARSSVGCGDAMVAAIVYGLEEGLSLEDCLRLALATSAAACTTPGTRPPERELVDRLVGQVQLSQR